MFDSIRLVTRRKELCLSQVALAKRAGISAQEISKYERGETRSPGTANLIKLVRALDCTFDDLLSATPPTVNL